MNRAEPVDTCFLRPAEIIVRADPCTVTTVLGSCVSVCLWDSILRIGGINHYMLPRWYGEGLRTPKFGDVAIARLIANMGVHGCRKRTLQAKIFGGATIIAYSGEQMNVGKRNIALAKESLERAGIPLRSADIGGNLGRKLLFNTGTGVVLIRKIRPVAAAH